MTAHKQDHLQSLAWWNDACLSNLDKAVLRFLYQLDQQIDQDILLLAALLNQQLHLNQIYLALDRLHDFGYLGIDGSDQIGLFQTAVMALRTEQLKHKLLASCLVGTQEGAQPLVYDSQLQRVYWRRYWRCQQLMERAIHQRIQVKKASLPVEVTHYIEHLFPGQNDIDWQKIACVLALRSHFSIITGGPGTGKTTTLSKLLAVLIKLIQLENDQPQALRILLAAPTGKAAARVSQSISQALTRLLLPEDILVQMPKQAQTLHRLLGLGRSRVSTYNSQRTLAADVVIIDEASMIDLEMMAAVLDALSPKTRLILLGDKDQLASVEAGAVLGSLCEGVENTGYDATTLAWIKNYSGYDLATADFDHSNPCHAQTVMLRHSHRFGSDSGIGQLARAVNSSDSQLARQLLLENLYSDIAVIQVDASLGLESIKATVCAGNQIDQTKNFPKGYACFQTMIKKRPSSNQPDLIDDWALQVLQAFDGFRVLSALRQGQYGVEGLNKTIESWITGRKQNPEWYPGRPVMVNRNDYDLGLMNGDIGICLKDSQNTMRVAFTNEQGGVRWISALRLSAVETAYAMTVHKSQGSEFEHVLLVLPAQDNRLLSRELVYTAITRAKSRFSLFEPVAAVFEMAVARSGAGR